MDCRSDVWDLLHVHDLTLVFDRQDRVVRATASPPPSDDAGPILRMLEGLEGTRLDELFGKTEEDVVRGAFRRAADTGRASTRSHRDDSRKRWYGVTALPLPEGVALHLVGQTARRTAERALVESEATLRAMLEHALDVTALLDGGGRFRFANPALGRLVDRAPEDLLGIPALDLVHPDDLDDARSALEAVLASPGAQASVRVRVGSPESGWRVLETVAASYTLPGSGLSVVVNARDITDLEKTREKARRTKERLRTVVERAPIVLWSIDADGTFLLSEGRGLEALGLEPGEVVGQSLFEIYEGAPKILEDARRALGGESVVATRGVDGAVFDIYYEPIRDGDGRVLGATGVAVDSTERQLLEDQLRQAQKMEAVGQLTGGIAHDFNNLLTVISTNVSLALSEAPEEAEPFRDLLEEIQGAARSAAAVVKKLLAHARRTDVEPEPIDLTAHLPELAETLRHFLPESIVVLESSDSGPVEVRVDPVTLEQIILNLGTNARDAMPHGGKVRLSTRWERFEADSPRLAPWMSPGRYGILTFEDDGPGMDEAILDHVFEPFFTTKPKGVGTGLGLAMVYGLTKQQGGTVYIETEPDEGARVHLLFPAEGGAQGDAGAAQRVSAGSTEEMPGGTETVLLVEDAGDLRRVGVRLLERFGYTVLTGCTGREGADVLRERADEVDLVVTDIVMPDMDGRELVRWMSEELGDPIPVLLVTGYAEGDPVGDLDGASRISLLRKPWSTGEFLSAVRGLLDAQAGAG